MHHSTESTQPAATIRLSGVSVHTNHGVSEAEREIGQRMVFDLTLELAHCDAALTDELGGTVDYGAVTEALVEAATSKSFLTLERLTTVIAGRMLELFDLQRVTVRATKPEPPIPVVMDGASVEVSLSPSDIAQATPAAPESDR
ncbi:MAG: dihydroneopterin aldolase [Solirubrobacterales bacterium]